MLKNWLIQNNLKCDDVKSLDSTNFTYRKGNITSWIDHIITSNESDNVSNVDCISEKISSNVYSDKILLEKTIENVIEKIYKGMHTSLEEIKEEKLLKKYKIKLNGWWDLDIKEIYTEYRRAKKKYEEENTTINKIIYKKAKKAFREKQIENKNKQEIRQLMKRNLIYRASKKKFHRQVDRLINEQTNTNIDINTGKIEIMKLFNDKINYKERIFDYKVDIDELKMIINKLENNKSCGYAKVTNEMFKFGSHEKLLNLIALIFETIINHNVMPKNFNI
ncbi:unnamed protein product, partial [Brachionus calyciflorus]